MYAVTYTPNVQTLLADGLALCDEGRYQKLMNKVAYENDPDGRVDGIILLMTKVDTAYSTTSYASLCLIKLDPRDIFRDTEAEGYDPNYVPFCEAINLTVLAYGSDCYTQIQNDPASLELYQNVLPDVEVLDENGDGTGEFKFNRWIEFDAPIRS